MSIFEKVRISSPLTAFNDLRTAELTPQFQGSFEYTVDNTELTINSASGGGTVTQGSGMAVIRTSATSGSTAKLISKRHARYRAGLGGLVRFTTLFNAPSEGTQQYFGLADEAGASVAFKNGLMIGYNGLIFGLHRFSNDTQTTYPISAWSDKLDGSGKSDTIFAPEKLNVWSIQYQYLGAGGIELFYEVSETKILESVCLVAYANKHTEPSSHNPNYHYTIYADNGATAEDLTIKSSSYAYLIEGKTKYFELHQPQFSSDKQVKTSLTTEIAIFTIRNKTLYAAKTNFIDILLENITSSLEATSANNLGSVRLIRDATLGGTPSFSDIHATDSIAEIDTSGTTVTGGKTILEFPLAGKNDKQILSLIEYDIIVAPGEAITVAGLSINNVTMTSSMLWKELF